MKTIAIVAILTATLIINACSTKQSTNSITANQEVTNTLFEYSVFSGMESYGVGDTINGEYYKVYPNGKFETIKAVQTTTNGERELHVVTTDSIDQSTIDSLILIVQNFGFLSYPDKIPAFLSTNYNRDSIQIIQSDGGHIKFSQIDNTSPTIQSFTDKTVVWIGGAEEKYYPDNFRYLKRAILKLLYPKSSYAGRH